MGFSSFALVAVVLVCQAAVARAGKSLSLVLLWLVLLKEIIESLIQQTPAHLTHVLQFGKNWTNVGTFWTVVVPL